MNDQQSQPTLNLDAQTRANKQKLTWGLVCLIAPTALFFVVMFLYAIINFIFAASGATDASSPIKTILNVMLFLGGAISFLTWLPGIIAGIVLLATRK